MRGAKILSRSVRASRFMIYVLPESPMLADVPVDETLTRPHGEAFQLHDRVDDGPYPATVAQ